MKSDTVFEKKEMKCPLCGETGVPDEGVYSGQHGSMNEQRCPTCKHLLFVRLVEER